jgi:hypothetical protein
MEIVYTPEDLRRYIRTAVKVSQDRPVLVDRFLEDATEVDVDCLSDGTETVIGGIMEHIEEAGVHSGDSACVMPSFSLSEPVLAQLRSAAKAMAKELQVRGLIPAAKEPRNRARNSRSRTQSAPSDPKDVAASALVLAPFQVTFVADQAPFRVAFNQIIAADPAVFIRSVEVTNSSLQGPSKSGAQTTTMESSPEMEGDPVEAQLKPILGQELLTISLRLSAVASGESSKEEN